MQLNFKELSYIVGDNNILSNMAQASPMQPFCDEVVKFLDELSKELLKGEGRAFSDVATFAFWCRQAAILKEKGKYDDIDKRLGKGIVFHSTPSNVPVNFAFSFVSGLLSGNANVVRLPKKDFEQVSVICNAVNRLLEDKFKGLAPYICMIKYPPIKEITDALSELCDCRVVWGGDGTVAEMRQSPLRPRATEINFADRYSFAVIDADKYIAADNKDGIANAFYNDTYFSDQNACTSPHVIVWLGEKKEEAKADFWARVYALAKMKYTVAPVQAVGKLAALYRAAAMLEGGLREESSADNFVVRAKVSGLTPNVMSCKYNSGFYLEYDASQLSEVLPICTVRTQTMTYYGLSKEAIASFVSDCRPHGIDRIVPMGKSMDFTLLWDGFDLIRSLSRIISVV